MHLRVGFAVTLRGGHKVLRRPNGIVVVVPVHAGETLGPGILAKVVRAAGLTYAEFSALI